MHKKYRKRHSYEAGQRFNSFVITDSAPVRTSEKSGREYISWKCLCDCGKQFITTTKQISKGIRKSCGCATTRTRFQRMPHFEAVKRRYMKRYIVGANRRSIEWALSEQEFGDIIKMDCFYCGSPPALSVKSCHGSLLVNGVDRYNNAEGYTAKNCVPCCFICNRAKGNIETDKFYEWMDRVKKYENKRK